MKRVIIIVWVCMSACFLTMTSASFAQSTGIDEQLERAGENRAEIARALDEVDGSYRGGMEFLIQHMPESDLQSLTAEFLIENVELAYQAYEEAPWKDEIPIEIFLNEILPYATVNEKRDAWRKQFHEQFLPLVADATSPSEAAVILNRQVFPLLEVRYSTQRKRADQSPLESMETGLASCTGLSIILVDACRSVGVPARLVGTPRWSDNSGNHSWVEIWDDGWHFTGACEPTGYDLNAGWFTGRASAAQRDDLLHAIYAVSYKQTPQHFPLVWDRDARHIFAVNVTDRYTTSSEPLPEGMARIRFRTLAANRVGRVTSEIEILDQNQNVVHSGKTNDERFDANDHLTFRLDLSKDYFIRATADGVRQLIALADFEDEQLITFVLEEGDWTPVTAEQPSPRADGELDPETASAIQATVERYFATAPEERLDVEFDASWNDLVVPQSEAIRELVWQAYCQGVEAQERRQDLELDQVSWGDYISPYVVKDVGERPENGWPLFIAMHGGGGVPPEVNNQQWRHMQIYYRDQPDVEGYRYLALRAPTDQWNGFYTGYNLPLMDNLIKQFLIGGDIDPNRVYVMGYSHGGYGTFYIARQMADRFAAGHASAAAPHIGNEPGRNLRNTRFTFMIGETDTRYERLIRCQRFSDFMEELKSLPENEGDYPVKMELMEGYGHGGLPDRDKIKELYAYKREPLPTHITWVPTSNDIPQFGWLAIEQVDSGMLIDAKLSDNELIVDATNVDTLHVLLDERLVDYSENLSVTIDGSAQEFELEPSLRTLCETIAERGDPEFGFATRIVISAPQSDQAENSDDE